MPQPKRRPRGHTLIEVIFVILTIMVIAGIAVSAYRRSREFAYGAQAIKNLNQIRNAEIMRGFDVGNFTTAPAGLTNYENFAVADSAWTYAINNADYAAETLTVSAQRSAGPYRTRHIYMNLEGVVTYEIGSSWPPP